LVILRYLMLTLRIYSIILMYMVSQHGKIIITEKGQHFNHDKRSVEGLIILARLIARYLISRHLTCGDQETRAKSDEHGSKQFRGKAINHRFEKRKQEAGEFDE